MHKTHTTASKTIPTMMLYRSALFLYPKPYRRRFGEQMYLVFEDLYNDQIKLHGQTDLQFWVRIVRDGISSVCTQHLEYARKVGMKKYVISTLNIKWNTLLSFVLMLPFCTLFALDLASRILQRDLTHYNRPYYAFLSHTFLLQGYAQLFWVILFPMLAIVLTATPILFQLVRKRNHTLSPLNFLSIAIFGVAVAALAIAFGHDVIPCVVNSIFGHGVFNVGKIIEVCKNA